MQILYVPHLTSDSIKETLFPINEYEFVIFTSLALVKNFAPKLLWFNIKHTA